MPSFAVKIHLHLVNGHVHRFAQEDPARLQEILEQITPRLFTQGSLTILGGGRLTQYASAALAGISLLIEPVPERLLHMEGFRPDERVTRREITEEEFRARQRDPLEIRTGEPLLLVSEVELVTGRRFWIETRSPEAMPAIEGRSMAHHFLTGPPILACHRTGGGVDIWNRAHIVSISTYPPVSNNFPAWPAEPLG